MIFWKPQHFKILFYGALLFSLTSCNPFGKNSLITIIERDLFNQPTGYDVNNGGQTETTSAAYKVNYKVGSSFNQNYNQRTTQNGYGVSISSKGSQQ